MNIPLTTATTPARASVPSPTGTGSYVLDQFAIDPDREMQRLNAQVDLFWGQELALYQQAGLRDGMRVLDCGCGPGHLLDKLHSLHPSLQCTGVEFDPHLVARARQIAAGKARFQVFEQSITAMEFPEDSFDFAIVRLVLEHLPDPLEAIHEVHRVLTPGGTAVFIDNDFDLHERTWPDSPALAELYAAYRTARRSDGGNPCIGRHLPALLKRSGFDDIDLHTLVAHSQLVGDSAFLKAEGAGIPAQLVQKGFLAAEALDRISSQWRSMLSDPQHSICRILFACLGKKTNGASHHLASEGRIDVTTDPSPVTMNGSLESKEQVIAWIREIIADELKMDPASLEAGTSLIRQGADSMAAMTLCGRLETEFSIHLSIADVLGDVPLETLAERILALARSASGRN